MGSRGLIAWVAVVLLGAACFVPWVEVKTFHDATVQFGIGNEYTDASLYLLACAAGAALGLAVRVRGLTVGFAVLALGITLLVAYELPGTMLQVGYEANLTWGPALALVGALALLTFSGATTRKSRPGSRRSRNSTPRT